jgi:hypothetical protein
MRLAVLLVVCVAAQLPTLLPGSRVRVEADPQSKIQGTVMSQTRDSIVVAASGAVHTTLPSGDVSLVKVSLGKSHMTGAIKGAKIGAVVLGGLGALFGYALGDLENYDAADYAAVAAGSAFYGALWGAGIGSLIGAEKWKTVYRRDVLGVQAAPARSGIGINLSIRY